MDNSVIIKTGCLLKAGKHKFQAWRKRWFVLRATTLKYYSSPDTNNESLLLGTLLTTDILSVQVSKDKKFSFDILVNERTYHVAAKTAEEREEWMVAVKYVSGPQQKAAHFDDTNIYAQVGENVVTNATPATNSCTEGVYVQVQPVPSTIVAHNDLEDKQSYGEYDIVRARSVILSSDSDVSDIQETAENEGMSMYATVGNTSGMQEKISSPEVKLREAQSDVLGATFAAPALNKERSTSVSVVHRDLPTLKPRALSEGMVLELEKEFPRGRRLHSLLFDLSVNEVEEEFASVEDVSRQLDEIFEGCYPLLEELEEEEEKEEEEEEEVDEKEDIGPFSLPPPRNGMETYAFDEIKKLIDQNQTKLDNGCMMNDSDFCLEDPECFTDDYPAVKHLSILLKNI